MKTSELKRLLRANGCYEVQVNVRGHDVWYSPMTEARFRVPRHQAREIATGTCISILKQAGIKLWLLLKRVKTDYTRRIRKPISETATSVVLEIP